ncbi:putative 25-hydroxycholesterol 7-alpha-hydroxylase [Paraphoma chrysanthemicola]|nr:putative 25-hydroxycholesterol 7-alpha-hydroxylase [Paraphoma chrysanthemicola]
MLILECRRDQHNLPIYTLRLPGVRMYVVNSISLLQAVQRQTKVLSFEALKVRAAFNISGASMIANEIVDSDEYGGKGSGGYATAFHKTLHAELSPNSPAMEAMNAAVADAITSCLDHAKTSKNIEEFGLFEWIKHEVGLITTDTVYGPENPFRNFETERSFWTFESGLIFMASGMSKFLKKTVRAREDLVSAFEQYFRNKSHLQGAGVIKARYDFNAKNQIPLPDIARFELGGCIALLTNIVPTCFWMIYHVYSDPTILQSCRKEISAITKDSTSPYDAHIFSIDAAALDSSCPTLLATFREVLRFRTVGTSARLVMQDHMLDGQYLLKKGGMIMMSGPVQHSDTSVWGVNSGEFDHTRFLKPDKRIPAAAFRAFGGGSSLCPGRHLATTIILGFTAMIIMQYDVIPTAGVWPRATTSKAGGWEVSPKPDADIDVALHPRKDGDSVGIWCLKSCKAHRALQVTVEDLENDR